MGELIQVDATPHPFFQGDNESYTLHGFMDEATGILLDYICVKMNVCKDILK